jgi:hypothetical protein
MKDRSDVDKGEERGGELVITGGHTAMLIMCCGIKNLNRGLDCGAAYGSQNTSSIICSLSTASISFAPLDQFAPAPALSIHMSTELFSGATNLKFCSRRFATKSFHPFRSLVNDSCRAVAAL